MLTPLSDPRTTIWMKQAIARFRDAFGRVNSVGGRLKTPKWMIGSLVGLLLLASILVAAGAQEGPRKMAAATFVKWGDIPLSFEPNLGQESRRCVTSLGAAPARCLWPQRRSCSADTTRPHS